MPSVGGTRPNTPSTLNLNIDIGSSIISTTWVHARSLSALTAVPVLLTFAALVRYCSIVVAAVHQLKE